MLEERVRAHTTPQRAARRARIATWRIAEIVRADVSTAVRWRDRYDREGLAGLEDRPHSGRPPVYGPEVRLRIVAAATSEPPHPHGSWPHRLIADRMTDTGKSALQVGRILAALDLKPHRVKGWLTRTHDPGFFVRAAEVCDLYLNRPTGSIVVSVDEKTAMSVRSRKHPDRPCAPGRPRRREFEYVRHGTLSITAALEVHTGHVVAEELPRNDSAHFTAFLNRLDKCVDPALTIHLVLDNGSSHTSQATRAWLKRHPRIVAHYTPKHASWINQVVRHEVA
ncbi:IS630 family transposase [Streptomyces sp. ISL-100]|uniref:IS630 family transposase n=1 Tax=Streptomyces sp. ISL-100 TaxID=2819173 RepID=UPI001BEA6252|nr:IS630 family transposase [Streptomyces sp. ISL-100]MBT2395928.1 IS630 family transposase [Streptomyces sp. ISL-100]